MTHPSIDGVLIQWGDRLFYPANRQIKSHTPRLHPPGARAAEIRSRIEATVRRAPQVMVKVTGGGRGMTAIAAHLRYISKEAAWTSKTTAALSNAARRRCTRSSANGASAAPRSTP